MTAKPNFILTFMADGSIWLPIFERNIVIFTNNRVEPRIFTTFASKKNVSSKISVLVPMVFWVMPIIDISMVLHKFEF